MVLKEIGGAGQNALLKSRVALVGAGGLGGPAALYLAAAGVGHLTVIDDDAVDLSNLQRQVQFSERQIAHAKVSALQETLAGINSDVSVMPLSQRLDASNAEDLLAGHDLILDGTDSFDTRFIVNKAAFDLKIPLVSGAIGRFDGQVALFPSDGVGPCYQCWVPEAPPEAQTCSAVGVVGALAGVIGSAMALEAVKYITGAGKTLTGRLWLYDGLSAESRTLVLPRDPACPICSTM